MAGLTDKERSFIRHALGLTNQKTAYRNGYFAGGDDVQTGHSLVAKAMAVHYPSTEFFPDDLFVITTKGFEAVREPGETLDREGAVQIKRYDRQAYTKEPAAQPSPEDGRGS